MRLQSLLDRMLAGDRRALARLMTQIENRHPETVQVLGAIHQRCGRAYVVGITGPPGAGKSTLVSGLLSDLRGRGMSVGVVAIDPSSPFSGGAVLGDRIRMAEHDLDAGVFVRSLASRGEVGGLSRTAARLVDVLDAFGFDVVLLETVGTGQSEVAVVEAAPTRLVVLAPGLGDGIQALKAGILEIADLFAVNKADLPDANRTAAQLRAVTRQPVHLVAARKGEGLEGLADALLALAETARGEDRPTRTRRLLLAEVARQARSRAEGEALDDLVQAVEHGEIDIVSAARQALARLSAN
jgi:LAO/AO transport system kinase